jgi:outer membrane protein, multidrug efflux system
MFKRTLLVAAICTGLSGCLLGPDYVRPESPLPPTFENASVAAPDIATLSVDTTVLARFWREFNDPVLDALIDQALTENHDLRIAEARLDEARASRREALSALFPTVTASGSRQRSSLAAPETPGAPPEARRNDYYEAGFDANWELSFFGRNIRGVASQRAFAEAAQAQYWGTQVAITAELARQYFELRGYQQRLIVAKRNADAQRESLEITRARVDNGIGNDLDRARAESQYESTLAAVPQLETASARALYRIGVLTGQPPAAHAARLDVAYEAPPLPEVMPVGNPAELLRRRPDIIAAERTLAARTNLIGYRMAELFPSITFTGRIGFAAVDLSDLGQGGTRSWRFGPSIRWAAFDIPRVLQTVKIEEARTEGALADYEKTVLVALEDAEGSLNAYGRNAAERDHRERAARAAADAVKLARMRFDAGISDFETVLEAERLLLQTEDALALSRVQAATSLIAVYKAMGGGWVGTDHDDVVRNADQPVAADEASMTSPSP